MIAKPTIAIKIKQILLFYIGLLFIAEKGGIKLTKHTKIAKLLKIMSAVSMRLMKKPQFQNS